jgi:hypothetical protein
LGNFQIPPVISSGKYLSFSLTSTIPKIKQTKIPEILEITLEYAKRIF